MILLLLFGRAVSVIAQQGVDSGGTSRSVASPVRLLDFSRLSSNVEASALCPRQAANASAQAPACLSDLSQVLPLAIPEVPLAKSLGRVASTIPLTFSANGSELLEGYTLASGAVAELVSMVSMSQVCARSVQILRIHAAATAPRPAVQYCRSNALC